MNDPNLPPPDPDPPAIADAGALFRDAPASPPRPGASGSAGGGVEPGDAYDVADLDEPAPSEGGPTANVPPVSTRRAGGARPATSGPPTVLPGRDVSRAVGEVWTRGAEWGGSLIVLAVGGLFVVVVLYALVSLEEYGLAFLALVGGGLVIAALSYPLVITLERPVRVTPEQAVRDFYAALSHHAPHYRRMWLLLSDAGKFGGPFATFDGFRRYWKTRLGEIKGGRASALTPLKFVVDDFRSEKSAGKSEIGATFDVRVFVRGKQAEGPVESVTVKTTLVKGPDRMWYLDRGTLP